jgi:hypothetical protein
VTVPGKGGRPRKWLSDTDRVRAYRARQRGAVEPPTVEVALGGDDELAAALAREASLQEQLRQSQASERELRAQVAAADRTLAQERRRLEWLEMRVAELEADLRAAKVERDGFEQQLSRPADRARRPSEQLNRAQRRQAKRRRGRG